MELMGHEDSEFDEQIILQKIRTYVSRIKLDDEKPLELTFSTREFSDQWSYFQYPSTLHTNILGEILKFQKKWLTYKIENKHWSSAFLMRPDEPLISKIKKFYHDELP
ncbi:hypothetical protein DASC09_057920 [Saccharomycopsis crataegensis]|uniref:Uncharacterized protein n=1 Tax=Saccharomycopsis crataegensis TaxID=43959 RepID=A0AAV5QUD1_9ASCO|nr:hypothetical protein DASC09_057920 [Saccharomycopsis crataegensis]